MYERILYPTDGSEGADIAVEHALELARRFDAPLHVLYAVDVTTLQVNDTFSGPMLDALEEEGKEHLKRVSERVARHDIDVTSAVVKGTPAHSIVEAAENDDLIVMATHGRTGLNRFLIGSTTEKVVRTADVPIVTVPMADTGDEDDH